MGCASIAFQIWFTTVALGCFWIWLAYDMGEKHGHQRGLAEADGLVPGKDER